MRVPRRGCSSPGMQCCEEKIRIRFRRVCAVVTDNPEHRHEDSEEDLETEERLVHGLGMLASDRKPRRRHRPISPAVPEGRIDATTVSDPCSKLWPAIIPSIRLHVRLDTLTDTRLASAPIGVHVFHICTSEREFYSYFLLNMSIDVRLETRSGPPLMMSLLPGSHFKSSLHLQRFEQLLEATNEEQSWRVLCLSRDLLVWPTIARRASMHEVADAMDDMFSARKQESSCCSLLDTKTPRYR